MMKVRKGRKQCEMNSIDVIQLRREYNDVHRLETKMKISCFYGVEAPIPAYKS
jgi:hypothetical protein